MKQKFNYDYMMCSPTSDVVLFACDPKECRERALKILLIRRADTGEVECGKWALPGGYLNCGTDFNLEDCAKRELLEEAGIKIDNITQIGTFSNQNRDPREVMGTPKRIITTAFMGTTAEMNLNQRPDGQETDAVQWWSVNNLPEIAFDHREIIKQGIDKLKKGLWWDTQIFGFVKEEFTLKELRSIFESILGKEVDSGNFRKFCLEEKPNRTFYLQECGKIQSKQRGKPAKVYTLKNSF